MGERLVRVKLAAIELVYEGVTGIILSLTQLDPTRIAITDGAIAELAGAKLAESTSSGRSFAGT